MYTPTQNYGLAMPSYGDEADIGVINDMVTSKVDELLFQNRAISAPPFEITEAYTEGDLVVYENVLYRFTAAKAAGAWDSSKVVQTSLAAEIENAGSGASSLSDLTDTDIDTPVKGEVLTWNGEDWVNAEGTPAVTKTATGNPIEITDGADAPLVKCVTQITGYQSGTGTPSPDNIRPIVAYTEGEIEVSDGDGNTTTHTTTYPSAIYRGREDCVEGEVTSEMVLCDLSDITWTYNANYDLWVSNGVPNGYKAGSLLVAELYPYVPTLQTTGTEYGIRGNQNYNLWCRNYDSVNAPSGMMAYELATPTTSSVTPTNLPIKSLSGYNHIESSTGDMEVEYITQGYQPLVDLIQSSNGHTYSTQEQAVGTWIDGSTIYEKTIDLGADITVDSSGYNITTFIPSDMDRSISCEGQCNTYHSSIPLLIDYTQSSQTWLIYSGILTIVRHLTIRYTKSTATTRSLSKGSTEGLRAEISEEKSEIKELPATDETTVKKAQSEGTETKEEADETEGNADEMQDETIAE